MTKLRKIPQRLADELLAPSFRDTTYRADGVIFLKYQAPCRMWQVQVFMLNYHSRCSQGCLLGQWWGCSEISHSMKGFMDTGVGAFPWAKTECKYSFILKVTRVTLRVWVSSLTTPFAIHLSSLQKKAASGYVGLYPGSSWDKESFVFC